MPNSIALEAQRIVREAAQPVRPGATVKEQMNAAARALGYPLGHWRIRAAWKGEAASWSAAAFEELKERNDELAATQRRRTDRNKQQLAVLYVALAEKLSQTAPRHHRAQIDRLIDTARALGDVAG